MTTTARSLARPYRVSGQAKPIEVDWFLACAALIVVLTLAGFFWVCSFTGAVDEIALKGALGR